MKFTNIFFMNFTEKGQQIRATYNKIVFSDKNRKISSYFLKIRKQREIKGNNGDTLLFPAILL